MRRVAKLLQFVVIFGVLCSTAVTAHSNPAVANEVIPKPISLYAFDESTGATTIKDSFRASGQGTIYGSPTFSPGQVGNAMCLNGSNQYATAPLIGGGLQEFTISAWVKLDSRTQWATVVKNWASPDVGAFHLGLDANNGYWSNYIGQAGNAQVGVTSSRLGSAPLGKWQYLVTTASTSAERIKLYVDNVLVDDQPFSGAITSYGTLMSFGIKLNNAQSGTDIGWLHGCIDEVAFWDVALTKAQLDSIRDGGGGVLPALGGGEGEPEGGDEGSDEGDDPPPPGGGSSAAVDPAIALDISRSVGKPVEGMPVVIGGAGLPKGTPYTVIVFEPERVLDSGVASGGGSFGGTIRMPGLPAGFHTVVLKVVLPSGEILQLSKVFEVGADGLLVSIADAVIGVPAVEVEPEKLAYTGVAPSPLPWSSLVLILLGLFLVVYGYRARAMVLEEPVVVAVRTPWEILATPIRVPGIDYTPGGSGSEPSQSVSEALRGLDEVMSRLIGHAILDLEKRFTR